MEYAIAFLAGLGFVFLLEMIWKWIRGLKGD